MGINLSIPVRSNLQAAWGQAVPVVLGYLPVGFAYGILAAKAGISPLNTLAMSILVYAGSAQLIAVGLLAGGASAGVIIITTFVVNLRHLLMAAALSPYFHSWHVDQKLRRLIPFFAFELTDEVFALHSLRFLQVGAVPGEALPINLIAQSAWVLGTWLGVSAGSLIQDVRPFGLDYALPAMFVALLIFQLKDWRTVVVALTGGALAVGFLLTGLTQWNVIIATIVAATLGVLLDSWTKAKSS